jgi:hypothetical protein
MHFSYLGMRDAQREALDTNAALSLEYSQNTEKTQPFPLFSATQML